MKTPIDPRAEYAAVERALAEVARLLEAPDAPLAEPRPAVSGWSIHQHLFHVVLATELSLRNVIGLALGTSRLARPFRSITAEALGGLESGRIERGTTEAPRMVRPPERVDPALLREIAAANHDDLARLEPLLDGLAAVELCVPHQAMGDLTALQWLRFVRVHLEHHLAIVAEIAAARER